MTPYNCSKLELEVVANCLRAIFMLYYPMAMHIYIYRQLITTTVECSFMQRTYYEYKTLSVTRP